MARTGDIRDISIRVVPEAFLATSSKQTRSNELIGRETRARNGVSDVVRRTPRPQCRPSTLVVSEYLPAAQQRCQFRRGSLQRLHR